MTWGAPMKNVAAAIGSMIVTLMVAAPALAFTPLHDRGGPVLNAPEIAPVYLGNWSQTDIDITQSYLQWLAAYMRGVQAPTGCQPVVKQYGVTGASVLLPTLAPIFIDTFTRDLIPTEIANAHSLYGSYTYAPNRVVLVLLKGSPANFGTENGGTVTGFHWQADLGKYYAAVSWELNPDWPSFERVISHEIFEAATDPNPANGVFPDQAWVFEQTLTICVPGHCFDVNTSEGGDECQGQSFAFNFGTVQSFADNSTNSCSFFSRAPGSTANCAPLAFTRTPFFSGDTRFFTAEDDWSGGDFKAECAVTDRVAGISATPITFSPLLNPHVALCETSYFGIGRGGVAGETHVVTGPDDRADYGTGDWDFGYYKAECGANEVVVGVSQSTASPGRMKKILCGSTLVSQVGNDDSRCTTLPFSHTSDDRLDTASGEWDIRYSKNECRPDQLLKGVSSNPITGEIHAVLCCNTRPVLR